MTQPNVGHFKDNFLPKSETFIYTLIKSHRRYRPIILDRHQRRNADLFPVQQHVSPAERFGSVAGVIERGLLRLAGRSPYLEHMIQAKNIGIIHAHFGQLGALFASISVRHKLPLITSFYGRDLSVFAQHPDWEQRFDFLWKYGDCFTALGPNMVEQLRRAGCPGEKINILPLPLNLDTFAFIERSLPSQSSPVRLLTVGRLVSKKGVDILIQALAHLPADINVELSIAGDGPERQMLERLAGKLGIRDRIQFLGWVEHDDVAALMSQAHVFVLSSRRDPKSGETEGSPTVLLEAQARGLPIISTKHADIPFIVSEDAGILVPENDAEALSSAIATLVAQSSRWIDMGHAGRQFVLQRHDMWRVGERLEALYDELRQRYNS